MIKKFAVAVAIGMPIAASAMTVDMSCNTTVRSFFEPLVQKRLINTKPYQVQRGSVNMFKLKFLAKLDAYGMPVTGVFGYTDDPLLFTKTEEDARDVYGVIVREGIANVQAQLKSMGADRAFTARVDAQSTAIFCKGVL